MFVLFQCARLHMRRGPKQFGASGGRGASPQIAGKGELAEETNKHGGAKSFGGNSRLWRRDALPASESLRESLGD